MEILKEDFYERKTLKVAKELLGKILIHEVDGKLIGGKIVETEAYLGEFDKASHAYGNRRTPRTMPLFGRGGTVYIYSIYGMYVCLNAIAEEEGNAKGVLIRAVEPLLGLDFMANKRNKKKFSELSKKEWLNLTSGPSKLCIAMDIKKDLNNTLFWGGEMYIVKNDKEIKTLFENKECKCGKVVRTTRIGIDYAEEARDYLYRFCYEDNPFVSVKPKKKD